MADDCTNCFRSLPLPRPKFCPQCGQETNLRPPRIGEFVQQFAGAYLSTEGALWRTLVLLLSRPGELTRRYLAGQRRHYVLPLRLFLTISVLVLLAARIGSTVSVQIDGREAAQLSAIEELRIHFGIGTAGLRKGQFYCENLPTWMCTRLAQRMDLDAKSVERELQQFVQRFAANLGGALFVLLPVFALWLKLVYWNRRLFYTEHLVFALHLHAFWFLMLALAFTGVGWITAAAVFAIPIHALLAARRVYADRWLPLIARGVLISALYLMTIGLAMSGLAVFTLVF